MTCGYFVCSVPAVPPGGSVYFPMRWSTCLPEFFYGDFLHAEENVRVGGVGPVFGGGIGLQLVDQVAGLILQGIDHIPVVPGGGKAPLGGRGIFQSLGHRLGGGIQLVIQIRQLLQQVCFGGAVQIQGLFALDGPGQVTGVAGDSGENIAADHGKEGVGLNGRDLAIIFQVDAVPGPHLHLGKNIVPGEQADVLGVDVGGHTVHGVPVVAETPAPGLLGPGVIVTVAVENNALVGLEGVMEQGLEGGLKVLGLLQNVGKLAQLVGHDGIEHGVGAGDGLGGAQHTEFELVAGKGQRRGAVAVRGVLGNVGHGIDANAQFLLGDIHVLRALNDRVQNGRQLITQKNGDDGRRGLIAAQTVVVAGI